MSTATTFLERLGAGTRTLIMGVLNVTPDSFSDGGQFFSADDAMRHAHDMIAAGADIIDIGGESTRPGAAPVPVEEEKRRVLPLVEALADTPNVAVSIDSWKADVAREALAAGAEMVNDVGGLHLDPDMAGTVAEFDAGVCIMHMQGRPQTMQREPQYDDVIAEIREFLQDGMARAEAAGVDRRKILIDPGIGFGKTLEHNLTILRRLRDLASLGPLVLIGTSRKSFLGQILDVPAAQRTIGSMATVALAIREGAGVVRVHDVAEAVQTARVADAICREVA